MTAETILGILIPFIGTGSLARRRKDSFYWYRQVIAANGEVL